MIHYPAEPGVSQRTVRLRSHAQARKEVVIREVWVFDCPRCGTENMWLRHARPLADGTLVCVWCFGDEDAHDLARCAGCGQMRPAADFAREPDPVWDAIAAALGGYGVQVRCTACRTPAQRARSCERCGQMFTPTRNDAKFCSGRCRVAAHRLRREVG